MKDSACLAFFLLASVVLFAFSPGTSGADVSDWCEDGQKAFARGKFEEANLALSSCLYSPPDDPVAASEGYYLRGETYLESLDYEAALGDFDRAIELDPENGLAWQSKAWTHYKQNALHPAVVAIETSLKIDPHNTESHHIHAQILTEMDRDSQAMDAYDMAYSFESKQRVQALQKALESQGYKIGSLDGVYGSRTRDALKACIADGCKLVLD